MHSENKLAWYSYRQQRQHACKTFPRGTESLAAQQPCFFRLDLTHDARARTLMTVRSSNQIADVQNTASEFGQRARGEGPANTCAYVMLRVCYYIFYVQPHIFTRNITLKLQHYNQLRYFTEIINSFIWYILPLQIRITLNSILFGRT